MTQNSQNEFERVLIARLVDYEMAKASLRMSEPGLTAWQLWERLPEHRRMLSEDLLSGQQDSYLPDFYEMWD